MQPGSWQFSSSIQEIYSRPFAPSAAQVPVIGRQIETQKSMLEWHLKKTWNLVWGKKKKTGSVLSMTKRLHKKSSKRAKIYIKALTNQKKFFYCLSANLIWFLLLEVLRNMIFPRHFVVVDNILFLWLNISLWYYLYTPLFLEWEHMGRSPCCRAS